MLDQFVLDLGEGHIGSKDGRPRCKGREHPRWRTLADSQKGE